MEVPRTLLAVAGKFPPGDYEDWRASAPPADLPAENCGRMPVIIDQGHIIGQSGAQWRYIARKTGLFGADEFEAARIDSIVETIKEANDAWSKLMPWGNTFTDEEKKAIREKWFTSPIPAAGVREGRYALWWLHYLEQVVGDNGFSVGNQLSLADAVFFNRFGDVASELGAGGEPFGSLEDTNKVLDAHPKIKKIVENFRSNENVQKWLAARGPQGF